MDLRQTPFEPDLARATTLPASWYTDPDVYALERQRIFGRTWQPVGRVAQAVRPGDFFTCAVAGEPLVVVCDEAGRRRAFYNVCRHRAGAVAEGCGNRHTLQCHYHRWTYKLDGRLLTTPEFEGVADFDKAEYGLRPVRVADWGPFVFVNLDAAAEPLETVLGRIPEETCGLALERLALVERREYVVRCNWKVYVDNYVEGYHIPSGHPALYRELDYAQYRVETFRYYSKQHAPIRAASGQDTRQYGEAAGRQALYYWVFPSWMVNVYPDNLSINIVVPLGVERTLTVFEWYVHEPERPGGREAVARSVAFSDQIQVEDIKLCEEVQVRLGSQAYERGRLSVARENGVHHFQGLVHEFLTARP
jgi:choline monooxygenase